MNFRFVAVLASFVACCAMTLPAQTSTYVTYKFALISYPGAIDTEAYGVNNHNVVVGVYTDSSQMQHGFKVTNGTFVAINVPGALETRAFGINDNGDIVGSYTLPNPPYALHGFLLHSGTFKTIDYPGVQSGTEAMGINNSGVIVGEFGGNTHGFVDQNGTFTQVDAPQIPSDLPQTVLMAVSNNGMMAGWVLSGDSVRGFWTPTSASDFDFLEPLFTPDNTVAGINARNDIVGCDSFSQPFVAFNIEASEGSESTEKFPARETLSVPFATLGGCVHGINYGRMIVGTATSSSGANVSFLGAPVLTLNVTAPVNGSTHTNPVHIVASASGVNPVSQIQVWVNSKEIYHVNSGSLNAYVKLPVGSSERLAVQAVDSKGTVAKVAERITVK
jgi:hypothetical protein